MCGQGRVAETGEVEHLETSREEEHYEGVTERK